MCQLRRGLRPEARVAGEAAHDGRLERLRYRGLDVPERDDQTLPLFRRDLRQRSELEWGAAREKLVQHRSERVEVRGRRHLLTGGLLRREIGGRPQDGAELGQPRGLGCPGNAEVRDLEHTVVAEQEVGRLDVSVHEPRVVRVLKAGAGLERQRLLPRPRGVSRRLPAFVPRRTP